MSPSAIFVFLLVSALHMLECILDLVKRRGSISDEQLKLRVQITELLKEASALSTPSTFAQAAKLKRMAGAKEKELAKLQELNIKAKQSLYEQYGKVLLATKVLIHAVLVLWFWRTPVTTVPKHLLQPFGRPWCSGSVLPSITGRSRVRAPAFAHLCAGWMFSWRGVDASTGRVVVGIFPWLFLSSHVSKLLSEKLAPIFLHP